MSIIQIAGTSGSGKSHLMRAIMDYAKEFGTREEDNDHGKVLGYTLQLNDVDGDAYVLGPYNVPTGGCDTSSSAIEIFEQLPRLISHYTHLLFEGLFVMNMTRGPQLAAQYGEKFCVLQLTTPLGTCLESVNQRRAERGVDVLRDTSNTQDNYRRARNYCAAMRDAGARVIKVSRGEALDKVLELLGESE
jgi:hypothetical protein